VPDLAGCTACGDTVEEVKAGIEDAVDLYVEELRADGQPVPEPTTAAGMIEAAY
jgi:predicted RNase H-like HicB family nuclease